MPGKPPFETLTEVLTWLSLNDEGRKYYALAVNLSQKQMEGTVRESDWKELDEYLKPLLSNKDKRRKIRDAIETDDPGPVDMEVIGEQHNKITASFKGFAVKWTGKT